MILSFFLHSFSQEKLIQDREYKPLYKMAPARSLIKVESLLKWDGELIKRANNFKYDIFEQRVAALSAKGHLFGPWTLMEWPPHASSAYEKGSDGVPIIAPSRGTSLLIYFWNWKTFLIRRGHMKRKSSQTKLSNKIR